MGLLGPQKEEKPLGECQRHTLSILARGGWLERRKKMRRLLYGGSRYDRDPDRMSFDLYTVEGTRLKRVDPPAVRWLQDKGWIGPDCALTAAGREIVEKTERTGKWLASKHHQG